VALYTESLHDRYIFLCPTPTMLFQQDLWKGKCDYKRKTASVGRAVTVALEQGMLRTSPTGRK
jgi:hypothetical protein